jgi:hypothetical protein
MISRHAAAALAKLAGWYPIVALTGPRQSGKTTLSRAVFPDKPYVSLEDPDIREFATADPRGFLGQYPDGAILDEAQRCPDLFSYLQGIADKSRRKGRFVVTGSQQFGLHAGISQSLAGRVGLLHLLPFSFGELPQKRRPAKVEELLLTGLYPPLYDRDVPPQVWFADYVATYIERDVRQMLNVRDLGAFQRFLRMCAARTGQLLNLSMLAADCGITHNTAKSWISILEASYLIVLLQPYHVNFGKRLVKSAKLYFLDPGLAAWLAGVRSANDLALGTMRGALFETWVVSEFVKFSRNRLLAEKMYFWRDSAGNEIDLLVERGNEIVPFECKSGQTVAGDWFKGLEKFMGWAKSRRGGLIYSGRNDQSRVRCPVFAWRHIEKAASWAFYPESSD